MGLAYEDYCDAVYEREYCMSDIDFGCSDCDAKAKELEECYDGYQLFRDELESIHEIYNSWFESKERDAVQALVDINRHILRLSSEAGVKISRNYNTHMVI